MVLSSISPWADSVADVYVLSGNSSDLQRYYYYHSSDEKRDTFSLSQNSSEGLGAVCCASFPLWCASFVTLKSAGHLPILIELSCGLNCSPTVSL